MKKLTRGKEAKYKDLRKDLAKEGFGTSLFAVGNHEHLRLSKVVDDKEVHKDFRVNEDFLALPRHQQVSTCKSFFKNN